MGIAGDFFERSNFLRSAVFQHREIFLLQSADVVSGFVGHERRNQHQLSTRAKFDFGIDVVFITVRIGTGKDEHGEDKRADYSEVAEMVSTDAHSEFPSECENAMPLNY